MHLKPGDVVKLKSGGPLMTVETVGTSRERAVLCVWSEQVSSRQVIQRGTFAPVVLERGPPRPAPAAPREAWA